MMFVFKVETALSVITIAMNAQSADDLAEVSYGRSSKVDYPYDEVPNLEQYITDRGGLFGKAIDPAMTAPRDMLHALTTRYEIPTYTKMEFTTEIMEGEFPPLEPAPDGVLR